MLTGSPSSYQHQAIYRVSECLAVKELNPIGIGMNFRGFKGKFCSLLGLGFSSSVCSTPIPQGDGALSIGIGIWIFITYNERIRG